MTPFKLNTGREIPPIGFGTWQITPDKAAKAATLAALETGFRVIDTAKIYGNERGVGEAIAESGLTREDIFITTKLWNGDQGYDSALKACQQSLDRLKLDYLDLYLIHWPASPRRHDSWRAFEKLMQDGLIKAAGVSNYTVEHLEDLLQRSELVPAVNQIEFHPFVYAQQREVLHFCQQHSILVEAYSPLSRLNQEPHSEIEEIAQSLDKTPQQVVLRWCLERHTLPLPRSAKPDHIRANFEVFDFELMPADVKVLDTISDGERVTWDPAGMG